jgi:head-tail adaptor
MAKGSIGRMIERITLQTNTPEAIGVVSVTRSGTTASVTTDTAHGFTSGDYVKITGADQSAYNGEKLRATVTSSTGFTYQVAGSPTTPATGTIRVTYVSDPQGNRKIGWTSFADVAAEMMPLSADERLAYGAMPALASTTQYRFRIASRNDLNTEMRVRWVPRWPTSSAAHVLEIIKILPEDDGRRYLWLDCLE